MEDSATLITISDVLEYSFCPKFIFYMHCLCIPQHEEQRFKVLRGREVHDERMKTNPDYLRKKLHVTGKELNIFLTSRDYHIKGIVDEVLFLEDGTAAPFEYKFAEFKEKIFQTYKNQLALHAIMIRENYHKEVNRGYICFTRSNSRVEEVRFTDKDFSRAIAVVNSILEIINNGYYPSKGKSESKCIDCCYRTICV